MMIVSFNCYYIPRKIRTEVIGTFIFFKLSDKKAKESVDYLMVMFRCTNCAF